MVKYRKLTNNRPKAFAGESIVAAGIGAAATLASAAIGSAATIQGAKRQALAQQQAAQTQAEALKKQNDNSNRLQEKQIEFTKKENEQNRDLQNQIQMNLQMLQGQQNENARLDAARIQVKKGGNPFLQSNITSLLRGGHNMPFEVTDGGYAMPIGITPQGYDLYELRGDNHEQYHKIKNGKYKSGIGIKAATGQVVEGEGGKRNAQGELMMVTPDDIKFISKHSLHGFNPTNAVLNGLDPQVAYNEQELIKAYNNSPVKKNKHKEGGPSIHIKPENRGKFTALQERTGKSATWFKENGTPAQRKMATFAINARKWNKRKAGGNSVSILDLSNPIDFSTDTIAPTVGGIEYIMNNREKQKCGGRIKKYPGGGLGLGIYNPYLNAYNSDWRKSLQSSFANEAFSNNLNNLPAGPRNVTNTVLGNTEKPIIYTTTNPQTLKTTNNTNTNRGLSSSAANYVGAGINAGAAATAYGLTALANKYADKYRRQGINNAASVMEDTLNGIKGIDLSLIKRGQAPHMMAALVDNRVDTKPLEVKVERALQRSRADIARNNISSAAAQNRYNTAETNAYDNLSDIYAKAQAQRIELNKLNQASINNASQQNLAADLQNNKDYRDLYFKGLVYNADVNNDKWRDLADIRGQRYRSLADSINSRITSNYQGAANLINSVGNNFASAIQQNAKNNEDWESTTQGLQWKDAQALWKKRHGSLAGFDDWWQQGLYNI